MLVRLHKCKRRHPLGHIDTAKTPAAVSTFFADQVNKTWGRAEERMMMVYVVNDGSVFSPEVFAFFDA